MHFLATVFFLLLLPLAAIAFPNGSSVWVNRGVCSGACKSEGNSAARSEIFLRVKGNEICGVVAQDNGASGPRRTPVGYFAGSARGVLAAIEFRDSFSDQTQLPGTAQLKIQKSTLRWMTTTDATGSILWISGQQLSKTKKTLLISADDIVRCENYLNSASVDRQHNLLSATDDTKQK